MWLPKGVLLAVERQAGAPEPTVITESHQLLDTEGGWD